MRLEDFFKQVPELFQRANLNGWESYEETLFAMRRPVTHGNYYMVKRFIGGGSGSTQALRDPRVHADLDRVLSKANYPRAGRITQLDEYAEGSTEFASALLHFNNPAYPIFDAVSVRGLNHVGYPLRFTPEIGEDTTLAYQSYIDLIQEFKDRISYRHVPERNYYLTRIVQLSLWQLGLNGGPPGTAPERKGPARRSATT